MTITRKEYVARTCAAATPEEAMELHRTYYGQYVEEWAKDAVIRFIGFEAILASTDEHFNDIPLWRWDILASPLSRPDGPASGSAICRKMAELGDSPSLSGLVCIYKEAARQIRDEEKEGA